ncbi:barstar family protein [Reyranella soli]|uniref:Barstar (barnase inhibitor) domain-containing protein n=1 Tax=Reyranella soli TaxID=1230389 RepID=A0A512NRW6_9HYPH|nr:hypothetical protein [Reyranella soli]GEP61662.1 hypothetical protein RSO01_88280 [Reyranella soli]
MRVIEVDGRSWRSIVDVYDGLVRALGGSESYGRSINALMELIVWDQSEPVAPYLIRVTGVRTQSAEIRSEVDFIQRALLEDRSACRAQNGYDIEAHFEIV